MLDSGKVELGKVVLDEESVHRRRSTESGDVVLLEHRKDVVGRESIEIIDEHGRFAEPLSEEFAPDSFAPTGIGDGEMETAG